MILNLYSVRDIKSTFACPFTAANEAVAKRQFVGCVNLAGNVIHDYPEDFQLWYVGQFDANDGKLISRSTKFICDAVSCVAKEVDLSEG